MPNLGAHVSTAGGLHTAFERATAATCGVIQLFSKNQRQWKAKPLSSDQIAAFQTNRDMWGKGALIVHGSYLINIASPDEALWTKSRNALADELQRCEQLGIAMLVIHPGSHVGTGEAAGLENIARALNSILETETGGETQILLENTAGQGRALGHRFEQLAELLDMTAYHPRIGICIDTCHLFAAGYDIRTPETYQGTVAEIAAKVRLERIRAFHLNDSKTELGSRVDRHTHIGEGHISIEGFRSLINDSRFKNLPMVLETPKEPDETADNTNLTTLRSLRVMDE